MDKLKGEGALIKCPSCKSSNIESYEDEYVDHEHLIQKVVCNDCGKLYSELWKVVDWEEV